MTANKIAQANKYSIPAGKRQERCSFKKTSEECLHAFVKGKLKTSLHDTPPNQQHVMKAMAVIGQGRFNERKTGAEGVRERNEIEYSNKHNATIKSTDNWHAKRQIKYIIS